MFVFLFLYVLVPPLKAVDKEDDVETCTSVDINNMAFTWHSAGHIHCHGQSYGEPDVDGESFTQGVSAEDGLSHWSTAEQLTNGKTSTGI